MNIGIVGARKYKDKQSVIDLVHSLPADSKIITSSCKGACTWTKEAADEKGLEVIVYEPDLTNIRAWFEVPKRYYQRNKELVEACNLLHAFISKEDGLTGGTKFEVEYAISLNIPVQIHWENGPSKWIFQYSFPFIERKQEFFLSWQDFFHKIELKYGGAS